VGVRRFVKINPAKDVRRWYVVAWDPTLFGTWAVVHAWGRPCTGLYRTVLGSEWSHRQVQEFATQDEACAETRAQVERRERRGYVSSPPAFYDGCGRLRRAGGCPGPASQVKLAGRWKG
jgi:predicted DNA-binding WGR domain protein